MKMIYYIAEMFNEDYPIFCMDEDGNTLKFDSEEEALEYAEENCQKGIVVSYKHGRVSGIDKSAKIAEIAYIYGIKGKFFIPKADLMDMYGILYSPIYDNWLNLPKMIEETPATDGIVGYITEYTNMVIDTLHTHIGGEVSAEELSSALDKTFKSIISQCKGGI